MGFLEDLLGTDPGAARTKRIDDFVFKRRLLREASAFSAMARSGIDIGPVGRRVIGRAQQMGLLTPLSSSSSSSSTCSLRINTMPLEYRACRD